jgi:hypothetical protein
VGEPVADEPAEGVAFGDDSGGETVETVLLSGGAASSTDTIVGAGLVDVAIDEVAPAPAVVDEDDEVPNEIATYHLPAGGKITYYPVGRRFETTCSNKVGHGNCRVQKRATPYKGKALHILNPSQGRCLGYMMAWLVDGCDTDCKGSHLTFDPTFAQRQAGRNKLKLSDVGRKLLKCERRKYDEELYSEPEICP